MNPRTVTIGCDRSLGLLEVSVSEALPLMYCDDDDDDDAAGDHVVLSGL